MNLLIIIVQCHKRYKLNSLKVILSYEACYFEDKLVLYIFCLFLYLKMYLNIF